MLYKNGTKIINYWHLSNFINKKVCKTVRFSVITLPKPRYQIHFHIVMKQPNKKNVITCNNKKNPTLDTRIGLLVNCIICDSTGATFKFLQHAEF